MSTRFSHSMTTSVWKPASFWREKRDTAVNLVRGFPKMVLSKQVKNTVAVVAFFHQQKDPVASNKNK